jgi:peptidoglycan/LPS O-acetylase OafA/YrhL
VSSNALAYPEYRPDIDGLRAVAVLSVIGFHAFPSWFRGGFIGVDIFFVISGFLITTILLKSFDHDQFNLVEFYSRRIKRIFPALILVLAAAYAVGWLVLFAFEYKNLGKHIAASAGFVANFVLWNEAGYFDSSAETKPLLHLWSLGIEEQFYILWPLLLYLAWKCRFNLLLVSVFILFFSFVLNVYTVKDDVVAGYYSPLTRFWELLTGGMLAYISLYRPVLSAALAGHLYARGKTERGAARLLSGATFSNMKSTAGVLLIAGAIWTLDKQKAFPGWWALLPTMGAVLIISAGPNAWLNRRLLTRRTIVGVGLISYPLYLWHWPLLSFAHILDGGATTPQAAFMAIMVSILLAWLTYSLVEKRIRSGGHGMVKLSTTLCALMGSMGYAGYYTYTHHGFSFRQKGLEQLLAVFQDFESPPSNVVFDGIPAWAVGNSNAAETIFVGDSTMQQYYPRIRELIGHGLDIDRNRIVFLTYPGCLPIPGIARERDSKCAVFIDKALPALNGRSVKRVVITALWTNHLKEADFYLRSEPEKLLRQSEEARDHAFNNLGTMVTELVQSGKSVFLILETPTSNAFDPAGMLPKGLNRLHGTPLLPFDPTRAEINSRNGEVNKRIQDIALKAGAHVINPMDHLCGDAVCPVVTEQGIPIYYNYDHLRASYASTSATYIDEVFVSKPTNPPKSLVASQVHIYEGYVKFSAILGTGADSPVRTQGAAILGQAYKIHNKGNSLRITVRFTAYSVEDNEIAAAIFLGEEMNSSNFQVQHVQAGSFASLTLTHETASLPAATVNVEVRVGSRQPGTLYMNGDDSGPRITDANSSLTIEELGLSPDRLVHVETELGEHHLVKRRRIVAERVRNAAPGLLDGAFAHAKQWLIRQISTMKAFHYQQSYQPYGYSDRVITEDTAIDLDGAAIMGFSWQPTSANALVRINIVVPARSDQSNRIVAALFVNGDAVPTRTSSHELVPGETSDATIELEMIVPSTQSIDVAVKVGPGHSGIIYLNGDESGPLPGMPKPTLTIDEYRSFWP